MKNSQIKINLKAVLRKEPEIFSETFFQIFTLITSIFAFAFLVAAASAVASPVVKAQTSQVCCEKLKGKDIFCQNSILSNCDANYSHAQTSCTSTDYCKPGCCYDSKEGTCAQNTPRLVCSLANGTFSSDSDCVISQCKKGCCIIGDKTALVPLAKCKKLSDYYGIETNFKSEITIEAACIGVAQAQDKGACVIFTGLETTCKLTTRTECKSLTHNESSFNMGLLCSAEQLGTLCTKQHYTGCVEGRDEVYWFDSCGNQENIYDADQARSWNSGKILEKGNSCNPDKGNVEDLFCGNCQYSKGTMCGKARDKIEPSPAYGDYICRDVNCHNTYNGQDYKHGESWCVSDYNVAVGGGKDAVGSRHWRHLCIMGEEKVEPCDDYRQGICVEGKLQTSAGTFNEASCRANAWKTCLDYTNKANAQQLCNQNPDCFFYTAWKFPVCLPQVPSGFDLKSSASAAGAFCGTVTQECKIVYVNEMGKGWTCKQNCECKEQSWVDQMNKWCTSLGDCGGKYNIAKVYSKDGYTVSGTSAQPSEGSSGSGSGNGFMGGLSSLMMPASILGGGIFLASKVMEWALTDAIIGVVGSQITREAAKTIAVTALTQTTSKAAAETITLSLIEKGVTPAVASTAGTAGATTMGQGVKVGVQAAMSGAQILATVISAVALVVSVYFLAKSMGFSTGAAIGIAVASVAAAVALKLIWTSLIANMSWMSAFGWVGLIVMVIMMLLQWLFGWGKTKVEIVNFSCLPWQPPSGGADCEKCNKPPIGGELRPCSKYRCDSLGAACSLLNEGTGNETCIWLNQNDVNSPTIKPWQDVLTSGHSYKEQQCPGAGCWAIVRNEGSGCVKAFTPLAFGIETNEPAQCRVDYEHRTSFDEMQFFFGDNLYFYNHSTMLSLPSPDAMNAYASPELRNDGNYTLYVRCRDANGNSNLAETSIEFCVDPGPDTMPPVISKTSVDNGAPVSYGAGSVPLDIYVNEPSECRWSSADKDYNDMEKSFSCASEIADMEMDMTYKCSTALTNIQDGIANRFYFRCKDQPWLTTNESDRNVNTESYEFVLQGTSQLKIVSAEPNGIISGGAEPMAVDLKAETSGGYVNGESTCFFSDTGYDNMIEFFITGGVLYSNIHEQRLELGEGNYTYYILCRDLAGNIDKTTVSFSAELDRQEPSIIRAYQEGGMLKIITDEESECRYGVRDCEYDFLSGTEMPFTNSTEHTAEWRTDITYYIKCMDKYGNMPSSSQCTMTANVYNVF